MDLSGLRQRILITLLCFLAAGFYANTTSMIFNEILGLRSLSAETAQDRQDTMERLLQRMDESTKPLDSIVTPSEPVEPAVSSQPAESIKTPEKPVEPARAVEPAKLTEPVKSAEPIKQVESKKAAEP